MKRRMFAGGVAVVALMGAALWLRPDGGADAAPGDVDLEISITGDYDATTDPANHTGTVTITVENDLNGTEINTTAEDVVIDVGLVEDQVASIVDVATSGAYDGTEWTIDELDAGEAATLTLSPAFTTGETGSLDATVQVVSQLQNDLDSVADEDAVVGNQDDEAVYAIQDDGGADPFTGVAFNDIDSSSIRDAGEPGVEDTFVRIVDTTDDTTLFWGRTGSTGTYAYGSLPDGTYDVEFTQPPGFSFSDQDLGPNGSDPDGTGVVTGLVVASANRAETDAGLVAPADLLLEKTDDHDTAIAGEAITYELRLSNSGPGATEGVEVVDELPTGSDLDEASIVDDPDVAYDEVDHRLVWTVDALAAEDVAEITYTLSSTVPGTNTNRAQVTASVAEDDDSDPGAPGDPCDGEDDCDEAEVEIGAPPTPSDDEVTTLEATPVTFNVLDGDGIFGREAGEALPAGWDFARVDGAAQGSVTCADDTGECTYTPAPGFSGEDGFSYTLESPTAVTTTQDVTIDVTYVNDGPAAQPDQVATGVGEPVSINVLANDVDPNHPVDAEDPNKPGDTLEISDPGSIAPEVGTWDCDLGAGDCTFDPAEDFQGEEVLTYEVQDSASAASTATVTLVVDPALLPTDSGFTGGSGDTAEAQTSAWDVTVAGLQADDGCGVDGTSIVDLTWDSVERADSYVIERQADGAGPWVQLATTTGTTFTDDGVGEGHGYDYRVTPVVGLWEGTVSAPASATIPPVQTSEGCPP